jgi:hypothetical protein
LTQITIPDGVTTIEPYTFDGCSSLTQINIHNGVTTIGDGAFYGCSSLTQINIPDGVTTIGGRAFEGCASLTTVTIPASVTDMYFNVFTYCESLTSINVEAGNENYSSLNGVLYNKNKTYLSAYPGGESGAFVIPDGVKTIDAYAFAACSKLSGITIPNSVTYIADDAFLECDGLTSIAIPSSVTTIVTGAFTNCSNLTSIDVEAGNTKYWSTDGALYEHDTYNITDTILHTYPGGKSGVFTIPDDVTDIAGHAFSSNLTSLTIPASVTSIGNFAYCSQLTDITVNWHVPLSINDYVFREVNIAEITLYVPAASVYEYESADIWKDFKISAIGGSEMGSLWVNYPASADSVSYKDMSLELSNADQSVKLSLTTMGAAGYSFNGLKADTYRVVLKNKYNDLLGEIDSIVVGNAGDTVAFASLVSVYTAKLNISGNTLGLLGKPEVKWFDATGDTLLSTDSIVGIVAGMSLKYSIELNEAWGTAYIQPPVCDYTATTNNTIAVALLPIPQVIITGVAKDTGGNVLQGATVTIVQTLNGKYEKIISVQTAQDGTFSLTVYNAPTALSVSGADFLDKSLLKANFNDGTDLGEIALSPVTGVRIGLSLSYTAGTPAGETAVTESGYADYRNIDYTLYNISKDTAITDFAVQYPEIVILAPAAANTQIRVRASSRNNAFEPVECTVTVNDELRATALLNITERGSIRLTLAGGSGEASVGMLYDASGILVGRYTYTDGTVTTGGLTEGSYQFVSMRQNTLFNAFPNLSEMAASGLVEGMDYLMNAVSVRNGEIATISIPSIPTLDESKLYYTGSQTSFTVNKTSITAGNYVTLRGVIDFMDEYAGRISNVKLIADIPDGCAFVNGSLMTGSDVSGGYTYNNGRLIVPLASYTDVIRFCVITVQSGRMATAAFTEFDLDGNTVRQPIGAAEFTSEGLSIAVPSVTAQDEIPIRGTAMGGSTVNVFDGDVQIAQTRTLADGTWTAMGELNQPYAFSYHDIYAEVTNTQGLIFQTNVERVTHDASAVELSKVTMVNIAYPAVETVTVFDFLSLPKEKLVYSYYPTYPEFTFKIEFTNNDTTKVSNVSLDVLTATGEVVTLPTIYDRSKRLWLATGSFDSYHLPTNVQVDFISNTESLIDEKYLSEAYTLFDTMKDEYTSQVNVIDSISALIDVEMEKPDADIDYDYIENLLKELNEFMGDETSQDIDPDFEDFLNNLTEDELSVYMQSLEKEMDALILSSDSLVMDNLFEGSIYDTFESTFDDMPGTLQISTCDGYIESEVVKQGFTAYETTGGYHVYAKYSESESVFLDFRQNICITTQTAPEMRLRAAGDDIENFMYILNKIITFTKGLDSGFNIIQNTIKDFIAKNNTEYVRLNNSVSILWAVTPGAKDKVFWLEIVKLGKKKKEILLSGKVMGKIRLMRNSPWMPSPLANQISGCNDT